MGCQNVCPGAASSRRFDEATIYFPTMAGLHVWARNRQGCAPKSHEAGAAACPISQDTRRGKLALLGARTCPATSWVPPREMGIRENVT